MNLKEEKKDTRVPKGGQRPCKQGALHKVKGGSVASWGGTFMTLGRDSERGGTGGPQRTVALEKKIARYARKKKLTREFRPGALATVSRREAGAKFQKELHAAKKSPYPNGAMNWAGW